MKITISLLLLVFCGTFMVKAQTIKPDQVLKDLLSSKRNLEQYNDSLFRKQLKIDGKQMLGADIKKEYQKNIDLIKKNPDLFEKYIADNKFNNRDSMVVYNFVSPLVSNRTPYQTSKLKYFDIVNTYLIINKKNELPTKLNDAHTPAYKKGTP